MSNSLAIAAVTATLRRILSKVAEPLPLDPEADPELADTTCTARPPDKARTAEDANQLNVFLYQTHQNAAFRNAGMPGARAGDQPAPPLALNLFYLITAYGRNFDDVLSHRLLGRAMSILHDRALLSPSDIEAALPGADLSRQFEPIRLSPQPMSNEELSKLWTTFQTPYRLSAAYEARVVLISSNRQSRVSPPVILRGPEGRGNDAVPRLSPAFAELTDVFLPSETQPAARLGYTDPDPAKSRPSDSVRVAGHDLSGVEVDAILQHRLTTVTLTPPAVGNATASGFELTLPGGAAGTLPVGLYALGALVKISASASRTTNVIPLAIAPRIVGVSPASPIALDADGAATVVVTLSPPVWAEQQVSLIVGDLEYPARALPASPAVTPTVTFTIRDRGPGTYSLRVRVDGVDSFLVLYADKPSLDPDAPQVVLT